MCHGTESRAFEAPGADSLSAFIEGMCGTAPTTDAFDGLLESWVTAARAHIPPDTGQLSGPRGRRGGPRLPFILRIDSADLCTEVALPPGGCAAAHFARCVRQRPDDAM